MDLPKRKTRGTRMQELIGEAKEADEEFWNQGAWQEVSEDESIGAFTLSLSLFLQLP